MQDLIKLKKIILIYALLLSPILIALEPHEFSVVLSNEEIALRYTDYLESGKKCAPVTNGPRVILTGFGLWSRLDINYSGFLLDNLASRRFWPEASLEPSDSTPEPRRGTLDKYEGVRIVNRVFTLRDGQRISACLILTDVLWDYAGAVVANEMSRFQPDAVLMTGVDYQAFLEAGATRAEDTQPGFSEDGSLDTNNIPGDDWSSEMPATLPMTWDAAKLSALIAPQMAKLGAPMATARAARPSNTYICNNLSYLALAAAKNIPLYLAGGSVVLNSEIHSHPEIGFFHLPKITSTDPSLLRSYSKILFTLMEGMVTSHKTSENPDPVRASGETPHTLPGLQTVAPAPRVAGG